MDDPKPCCAKCGADAGNFVTMPNSQHSLTGFLVYCRQCGGVLTWVQHASWAPEHQQGV